MIAWGEEERSLRLSPAIGGPRQAKACWGEDERRQRLRATNGSPRLSDASEDEEARLSDFSDDERAQRDSRKTLTKGPQTFREGFPHVPLCPKRAQPFWGSFFTQV